MQNINSRSLERARAAAPGPRAAPNQPNGRGKENELHSIRRLSPHVMEPQ